MMVDWSCHSLNVTYWIHYNNGPMYIKLAHPFSVTMVLVLADLLWSLNSCRNSGGQDDSGTLSDVRGKPLPDLAATVADAHATLQARLLPQLLLAAWPSPVYTCPTIVQLQEHVALDVLPSTPNMSPSLQCEACGCALAALQSENVL